MNANKNRIDVNNEVMVFFKPKNILFKGRFRVSVRERQVPS